MKRFGWRLIVFALALSAPLAYFVARTYSGMAQEEEARLRFFAESLLDNMERELAMFVREEESRPVDAYAPTAANPARPQAPFVVGYLQNNPDGSLQIPAPADGPDAERLRAVNALFNQKRNAGPSPPPLPAPRPAPRREKKSESSLEFADRFLRRAPSTPALGQRKQRTETLYPEQARQLAPEAAASSPAWNENRAGDQALAQEEFAAEAEGADEKPQAAGAGMAVSERRMDDAAAPLQAEVGPLQSVFVDAETVVLFRRVAVEGRLFRQGVVIRPEALMDWLIAAHFAPQPLAEFSHLTLISTDPERAAAERHAGPSIPDGRSILSRTFPRPFAFLQARLAAADPPPAEGRGTLTIMLGLLSGVMGLGLFAIYRGARTVTELAERRSAFVSAVTHELKTPLTTIRMYIEMLASGMAATPEREQEYFTILNAEAGRLSRLIQNILDFSKLERREFRVHLQTADPAEAVREARSLMEPAAERAGFDLSAIIEEGLSVSHDRELLVQVLVNLIENSIKFGADGAQKEITLRLGSEKNRVSISVADTGPGIPRKALKKVFEEFYRVDGALTRKTRGTGIGLAFVRRVVTAMGGQVRAENNDGDGCTVTIRFPAGDGEAATE
ncbi:MAG: sensor histidine kinase [Desulfococcaceae bacterium]